MKKFPIFMSSMAGRVFRAVVGAVVIAIGIMVGSGPGYIIIALGIVMVLAGLLNFCLFGPLFKMPFSGKKICDLNKKS